jgi:preprotein translocase subunit SecE
VSDERDPDAAGDDTTTGAVPTGLPTGPLRPTGKRSRTRDGGVALAERTDDEALTEEFESLDSSKNGKKVKKAKASEGSSRNPFVFIVTYIRQVVAEMKKVIWPDRKQMVNYTIVVLVFLTFMTVLIGLVDLGLAKLMLQVFG